MPPAYFHPDTRHPPWQRSGNGVQRRPFPFGPFVTADGCEFRVFSRQATGVDLVLLDPRGRVVRTVGMERQGDVWCVFVPNVHGGQRYAFLARGTADPQGAYPDPVQTFLLDPYAFELSNPPDGWNPRTAPAAAFSDPRCRPASVVPHHQPFDWQGLHHAWLAPEDVIVYEVHVKGFTAGGGADVGAPGTYAGFIERLDHLKHLGVTAVELLPVQHFDPLEVPRSNPKTGARLVNYWGYSTAGFFAPHRPYAAARDDAAVVSEFKALVRELHRAEIAVILDVVYNHTAEGSHQGPTIHLRGFGDDLYYHRAAEYSVYRDYSGCGNSLQCNHPVVQQLILDSLRHWVEEYGIDGFRFDLASVLCRDRQGRLVDNPPLIDAISEDPALRDCLLIAEAWDAGGAYQVGSFPNRRWAEWNGKYRDDVRQFWRGDPGKTNVFASRLAGSSDLYQHSGRKPYHSVNFVTCHDGFPLNDLVSYAKKHNDENGEKNRDGENHNNSFNCGVEGPTDNLKIDELRMRLVKNYLATLFASQGTPMLLGGDEFRRTQGGNNNAYCQDNEISWFDWTLAEKNADLIRFVRQWIAFRKRHPSLRRREFFTGSKRSTWKVADVNWYNPSGKGKDWSKDDGTLVVLIAGVAAGVKDRPADDDLLLLFNASERPVNFRLAPGGVADRPWVRFCDTGEPSPRDVSEVDDGPKFVAGSQYPMLSRSMACFWRSA